MGEGQVQSCLRGRADRVLWGHVGTSLNKRVALEC